MTFKKSKFNQALDSKSCMNVIHCTLNIIFSIILKFGCYMCSTCTYIVVYLGDTVVLRRTELGFMDEEDSDERLRIILNSYIAHGSFKYKAARLLQKGSSFTQQDVNDGLIR